MAVKWGRINETWIEAWRHLGGNRGGATPTRNAAVAGAFVLR